MMSNPVTSTEVGKYRRISGVSSGQPSVPIGQRADENQANDPAGFLKRIDADQASLWVGAVLRPARARTPGATIRVIPGGPAIAAVTRAVEARGGLSGLRDRTDVFHRAPGGRQDTWLGVSSHQVVHPCEVGEAVPCGVWS
jgi:hypothetical protein